MSYPPEDVRGFIRHKGVGSKCSGCWKVYGDEEQARKLFASYKKCTDIYCRCWKEGVPLERLSVKTEKRVDLPIICRQAS